MKWQYELSNLLITHNGKLVKLEDRDFEILGVTETNGDLNFKLRK